MYTVEKVNELIEALRSEAKLLLLFLRSIHTIEVFNIDKDGNHTLTFQTMVAKAFVDKLTQDRISLLMKLKSRHSSQKYNFSEVFQLINRFDISVYDASTKETSTSRWLVVNQVGTSSADVREASVKQKVFPWVGTAVDLDHPADGRIFCFLPMPIETSSNLPIHVNATFGLNDDRRSLKWPGVERKNDPTANWNELLVQEVIPSCYVTLLLEAKNMSYLDPADFYKAWPNVNCLSQTQWESIMRPVFQAILSECVIWSKSSTQVGEWVTPNTAVYVPKFSELDSVVEQTLTTCGVKLATVPSDIWDTFAYVEMPSVTKVNPRFVKTMLHGNPSSYTSVNPVGKRVLLKYCLSDGRYDDLSGLRLLPLCDGNFEEIQNSSFSSNNMFICTQECPRYLLPNLDHKLVDLPDDVDLHNALSMVARSRLTHLKELAVPDMPSLINESMPTEWKKQTSVSFPNLSQFPSDWFQKFWQWVQNKQLSLFLNMSILPVRVKDLLGHFDVVKLSLTTKSVVYVAEHFQCNELMLSLMSKFGIHCCVQGEEGFRFVKHNELRKYTNSFDPDGLVTAISYSLTGSGEVTLSPSEADCLRKFLCGSGSATSLVSKHRPVLCNIRMFVTASNTAGEIYSVNDLCRKSSLSTSIAVEETSSKELFDFSLLPSNIIILSSSDLYQKQLLKALYVPIINEVTLLSLHIFPLIENRSISDHYIDSIMLKVLDKFHSLKYNDGNFPELIKHLSFVITSSGGRESPEILFDPENTEIFQIFAGKDVFPCAPYNQPEYVDILRDCGLRTSIPPQEILDTIYSISLPAQGHPQCVSEKQFTRAKAILQYTGRRDFKEPNVICSLPRSIHIGHLPFSTALDILSSKRCWLPVNSSQPAGYPSWLPWKGEECTSHLCALDSTLSVSTVSKLSHPLIYGSQLYFTDPVIESGVLTSDELPCHLVAHLQQLINNAKDFSKSEMLQIMHKVYSALLEILHQGSESDLSSLWSSDKWIYIMAHNKFVSPSSVALEQNSSFRHNLEPYLHKLPDSICNYSELFTAFGVNDTISKDQIISVMAAMKEDILNGSMLITADDCWNIVMAILNWLTENGNEVYSGSVEMVYVPVESDSKWPDLRLAKEVTYTDNEFLKKFSISSETDKPLVFVHSRVSVQIAECLKLTPLSEELDISGDTFEDTGQYEPLTTRLRNILHEYKDGLTIVKELIQNADDAEATEVNICYDARTHSKETSKLFFPGMSASHGPALVIHNNQVFQDDDFENITKLAGATKQKKHLKIGKFGIGFCSVYHITDVPSFISRDRLYIFDPTLKHLGKEVRNPALPGKKLTFTKRLIQNSKQLEPYDNLFHFNRFESYQGTMFRLPFRTSQSELSGKCYTEKTAMELLEDIYNCCESLILFLQHVHTITYQRINSGESHPTTLFTVHKEEFGLPLSFPADHMTALSIDTVKNNETKSTKWLTSNCSMNNEGKVAVASVACRLDSEPGTSVYRVQKSLRGEIFCYLPLSQSTGLPAHVSCNFAVINNRRGIWTADESSTAADETEVEWNQFLMDNVIPVAYLRLLFGLRSMKSDGMIQDYRFYDLWPLTSELKQKNPWSDFVSALYIEVSRSELFYSMSNHEWKTMKDSIFLKPNILCRSGVVLPCIKEVLAHLKYPLVDLPIKYRSHFNLKEALMDELAFIKVFFSELSRLGDIIVSRNAVIQSMLETYASELDNHTEVTRVVKKYMQDCACIPCSPDGSRMRKCSELIHPGARFSKLYDPVESMFPLEELVKRSLPEVALNNLGIIQDSLPWQYVIERAQTIEHLMQSDSPKAFNHIKFIIEAITSHTVGNPPRHGVTLDSIDFLPVMKKPDHFPLKWCGEGIHLCSGNRMMKSGPRPKMPNVKIAGSQAIFLWEAKPKDEGSGHISERAEKILSLKAFPSFANVIAHFELIINDADSISSDWIDNSCQYIYDYMDDAMNKKQSFSNENLAELTRLPCIWTGRKFICASEVSFKWALNGPYLYQVPSMLMNKKMLCSGLGIKRKFSVCDIRNALLKMKNDFGEKPVDKACQEIIRQLIPLLLDDNIKKDCNLFLPDENYILYSSNELAYNDAPWTKKDTTHTYVNKIVPRELAKSLGVVPVRSKFLDKYISVHGFKGGVEFGQHEDLTRRIQNILRDYPLDVTLLKELLQNADDSKAKKMYVILDKRYHKSTSILSEEWQDLQGPALLVWNDSVFSEKDLEGIQKLGLGSKRSEADTIGQYGIGFNVVYHITDCPSFVTNETLCVFDPHCRYTPGANPLGPGRRYDKLSEGFWTDFPDMKSAYLRDNIKNIPSEVLQGSLFRFPIRHPRRVIKSSEIVDGMESSKKSLSSDELYRDLETWVLQIKEAMFFLNNVTEIKIFVIEEKSNKLKVVHHYRSEIEKAVSDDRTLLQTTLSNFKMERNCKSCVIMYPLTIIESERVKEKWLIQQGVGDIYNEGQTWKYVKTVKPRHGIAAPLSVSTKREGQVFCFLPLPVESGLPVHVNGHFILNSTRRELWKCSDISTRDDRSRWNDNLVQALASSYAHFLVESRTHYLSQEYKSLLTAINQIEEYFSLFPKFNQQKNQSLWQVLAHDVYKFLLQHNHMVFCVVVCKSKGEGCGIKWCPPKSSTPSSHIYYWHNSNFHESIYPILERIGMNITPATSQIMTCFNAVIKELRLQNRSFHSVSRESVFEYYTKFSSFSSSMQPVAIKDTAFQSVDSFLKFTEYLLAPEDYSPFQRHPPGPVKYIFPGSPFSHSLLITANEKLRMFEGNGKILISSFSHLFPNSLDSFLHPDFLPVNFTSSYFIQPGDNDTQRIASLILRILEGNLPRELKSVVVTSALTIISRDRLRSLWKCFKEDKVFNKYITTFLSKWALLLTRDDRLFSTSSNILPVCYYSYSSDYVEGKMHAVLTKLKIPFLDTSVVVAESNCPTLAERDRILSNIYHANKETPLIKILNSSDLGVIIDYLRNKVDLRKPQVIQQIQSLPLFENIDGSYTSILNKNAFVWPVMAFSVAYQKWLKGYDAVFIKGNGKWCQLGSAEQLSVRTITAEELYVRYIFPHFHKLNSKERYQHLEYIRNNLYFTMKQNSITQVHHRNLDQNIRASIIASRDRALSFINSLKALHCIGNEESSLHPVRDFCDHTVEIFKAFSNHFRFLPDEYRQEDQLWLPFLRELGLKQTVSKDEYLQFCHETANGKVADIKDCSNVLLEYLFSDKGQSEWRYDTNFLQKVSNISFVLQQPQPQLSWVVPSVSLNPMVKLNGSAPLSAAALVWTLRPIIELPCCSSAGAEKSLGIVRNPTVSEVIANVKNICEKSQFSEQSLFVTYPKHLLCSAGRLNLMDIMLKNLTYINSRSVTQYNLSNLQSLPCIPVYNTTAREHQSENSTVLVKPCCVVDAQWLSTKESVKRFHPFLHCLPDKKFQSIQPLLQSIGVKGELELCHIQMVLEEAYKASEEVELDVNTEKSVIAAIQKMEDFLKQLSIMDRESAGKVLSPLYLPDADSKLKPAKLLLYGDTPNYWNKMVLDLSDVPYYHFNITSADYKVSALDICRLLPNLVRPIGLSTVCRQELLEESTQTEDSEVAIQLMKTIELPDIPEGIVSFISRYIQKQEHEDQLKELVQNYFEKIDVVTIADLKTKIILTNSRKCIGTLPMSFSFVPGETKSILYLDSDLAYPVDNDDAYLIVANHLTSILCKEVKGDISPSQEKEISDVIKRCLKAKTADRVQHMLLGYGVDLKDGGRMHKFMKKLGEEIPKCWHHRLDQDVDNIFNPMEYVGYQNQEGNIIIAQIVHPVKSETAESELEKMYRIYTSESDVRGKDVSMLLLYKFLVGHKKPKLNPTHAESDDHSLVPFSGNDDVTNLRATLHKEDLIELKKKICKQLREIWKLPSVLRRKALKRLYLRWHPDKNQDNPTEAEEIFKFLMKQIDHLERGEPLDDPKTESDARTQRQSGSAYYSSSRGGGFSRSRYYHYWSYKSSYSRDFHNWSYTAGRHNSSSNFERTFFHCDTGTECSSSHTGHRTTRAHSTSDYFPFDRNEDERNPEEGRRWLKQAEADFEVLVHNEGKAHNYVCFMAHQVAEKALKGGVYALCGMDGRAVTDTDLTRHAYSLETVKPRHTKGLAQHCIPLESYYLDTRYPKSGYIDTPTEHYTSTDADQAKLHAKAVLDTIKSII